MTRGNEHPLAGARELFNLSEAGLASEIRKLKAEDGLRSKMGRQRVWTWEHGVEPNDESQRYMARVFGIPQDDVTRLGWPHWLPGQHRTTALGTVPAITVLRAAQQTLNRRTLFRALGSAALLSLAVQWSAISPAEAAQLRAAETGEAGCDEGLVGWLERTTRDLGSLPTIDRQHTVELIDSTLSTVNNLIDAGRYDAATGRRLHVLAAQLGQTAGWTRFDVGEHGAAGILWEGSLHAAHAASRPDLGASVFADFAYQAVWLRDPGTAVGLLERTLPRTAHPVARGLLHLRKARAHAVAGERRQAHRELGASEAYLAKDHPDPAPSWCAWMSPADHAIDAGRCFLDLGDTQGGLASIERGLAQLSAPRAKTTAIFRTYQAEALARSGEPEQAARVLSEALDTAKLIGAVRVTELARQCGPAFAPYARAGGVPQLLARLRTAA